MADGLVELLTLYSKL